MSMDKLSDSLIELGAAIEACIEKKTIRPALMLLYSAIDIAGWLNICDEYATKASFTRWADEYLLKANPLQCTAIDLYAARCGMLHTYTPESRLKTQGEARYVCYAWGKAKAETLARVMQLAGSTDEYVAVHVDELFKAWQLGVVRFLEDIERDPERKSLVHRKAKKFFENMAPSIMDKALDVVDSKGVPESGIGTKPT